jgi:hypothetical protein
MRGDTNGTDYLVQKITWIMVLQLLLLDMQGQGVERIVMHKSKFSYCRWTCFGTELTWLIWGRRWEDCCTHNAAAEIIACIWQTLYVLPNRRSTSSSGFLSSNNGLACWRVEKVMLILWQKNVPIDKSIHFIQYYCNSVFRKTSTHYDRNQLHKDGSPT